MQLGMKTRMGPQDHVLCGGSDSPEEKAIGGGVVPRSKMHYNSESADNGCINYTINIATDSVWPQQYTGWAKKRGHVTIILSVLNRFKKFLFEDSLVNLQLNGY